MAREKAQSFEEILEQFMRAADEGFRYVTKYTVWSMSGEIDFTFLDREDVEVVVYPDDTVEFRIGDDSYILERLDAAPFFKLADQIRLL